MNNQVFGMETWYTEVYWTNYRPLGVRRAKPACCRGASPYRKGSSESILTSSLAGDIARCHLKRRQRHWWAG